jgi:HSP20 family molecular chaperone IbpA
MTRAHAHQVQKVRPGPHAPETTSEKAYVIPVVDIYETPEALVLEADLPGVPKEGIEVKVDADTLTVEAKIKPAPAAGELVHQELELADYHRCFTLPNEADTGNISADFDAGVLRLVIPRAPAAQARKIEVKTK